MTRYTFKGWTIGKNGNEYSANKGGFFTGYHTCSCPGAFLDILEKQYARI